MLKNVFTFLFFGKTPKDARQAQLEFNRALELETEGNFDEAELLYKSILHKVPGLITVEGRLAGMYTKKRLLALDDNSLKPANAK